MSSFTDAIKQKSTTKATVSKSSMPIIDIKDTAVASSIADFIEAQVAEKTAKADKEFAGAEIISHVRAIQDEKALNGSFAKSYQVKSSEGNVKFVTADKFSVNSADEDKIKNVLGKSFDNLMEEKVTVTLKEEIFADEDKQEELMGLLGEDKFAEFFDVDTKLTTVKGFDQNVYGAVKTQKELDEVRLYAKQNKPSIR